MHYLWFFTAVVFLLLGVAAFVVGVYFLVRRDRYLAYMDKHGQTPMPRAVFALCIIGLIGASYLGAIYCNQKYIEKRPNKAASIESKAPSQTISKEELKVIALNTYQSTQAAMAQGVKVASMTNVDERYLATAPTSRLFIKAVDTSNPLTFQDGQQIGVLAEPYGRCAEYAMTSQFLWGLMYSTWINQKPIDAQMKKDLEEWTTRSNTAAKVCSEQLSHIG